MDKREPEKLPGAWGRGLKGCKENWELSTQGVHPKPLPEHRLPKMRLGASAGWEVPGGWHLLSLLPRASSKPGCELLVTPPSPVSEQSGLGVARTGQAHAAFQGVLPR